MEDRRCPACGGLFRRARGEEDSSPFCSRRCRTLDLGNWIDERYRVEAEPTGDLPWPAEE